MPEVRGKGEGIKHLATHTHTHTGSLKIGRGGGTDHEEVCKLRGQRVEVASLIEGGGAK